MRVPPEVTTSALTDPLQWIVLIGYGLATAALAGLAIGFGLVVAICARRLPLKCDRLTEARRKM